MGLGGVWQGSTAEKGGRKIMRGVFLWFGGVQWGSVGLVGVCRGLSGFGGAEDARWPGGQEEKASLVVQW